MFLDPLSDLAQAGKMEEERVYSGGAVFRQNKSYIAYDQDGCKDVKFKGVSRSAREALEPAHFGPPREGRTDPLVSSWRLSPTPAGELVLNVASRILPSRVNYKRCTLVSRCKTESRDRVFLYFFLLQGPYATLPLR